MFKRQLAVPFGREDSTASHDKKKTSQCLATSALGEPRGGGGDQHTATLLVKGRLGGK